MKTLETKDLAQRIDEILRMVEQGETVEIVDKGKVVARVIPPASEPAQVNHSKQNDAWKNLERLSKEIGKYWTDGVDAVDAVRDVRREL